MCVGAGGAARGGWDHGTIEDAPLAGHQVTLLDLLRLLRQRRRTDATAQTFVAEQLRLAASNVMQVLFGLHASERLVASANCILAAPPYSACGVPVSTAAAAVAVAAAASAAVAGGGGREGRLYVTARVLSYSTMLASDLRGITDVTFKLRLKDLREVHRGESADSLVLTTAEGDVYGFNSFGAGERDRLLGLLLGTSPLLPTLTSLLPPSHSTAAGGASPRTSSPRHSAAAALAAQLAPGGIASPRNTTPRGSLLGPGGLARPPLPPALGRATSVERRAGAAMAAMAAVSGAAATMTSSAAATTLMSAATAQAAAAVATAKPSGQAALAGATSAVAGAVAAALAHTGGGGSNAAAAGGGAPPPPRLSESGALPLLSTPCHLVNVLRNKDGMLHLFGARLDFACAADPPASRSVPLADINNVTQRPGGWGGGSVLVLSVEGGKVPLMFGGMGDAVLAALKQSISELCYANG
ncbi:hypothetical protein TSOC_001454 [Tetrabaena socialis]|uniref:Uncharacterized protein n=1 Tax=Tetrabaena socialis TaxID=47790 RepID=A0A2J8AGN5_9CHLO|nr:hypothetical protein TSOC_001454 [Tetrabaena socialis]|eukprot:PNH11671.1 hypothetical protein TSOC_001454 [Tetrabaena socialis]